MFFYLEYVDTILYIIYFYVGGYNNILCSMNIMYLFYKYLLYSCKYL